MSMRKLMSGFFHLLVLFCFQSLNLIIKLYRFDPDVQLDTNDLEALTDYLLHFKFAWDPTDS